MQTNTNTQTTKQKFPPWGIKNVDPDTRKTVKAYAAMEDRDIADIIKDAVALYVKHGGACCEQS